jgi:hypothetical protein
MAPTAAEFIAEEKKFLGVPYVYGGESPSGFDCSGLVQYCLNAIGVRGCPRTSELQWSWCKHVSHDQLTPGTLVFESWPHDNAPPGHVITYIGDGQVIEAPQTGQVVHIRSWSPAGDQAQGAKIIGYGQVPGLVMSPPPPPPPTAHPPTVAVSGDGAVNVFWRGEAGFLWHGTGAGTGALKGTRLGSGPMESGPAAGVDAQGHLYVFWTGTDGNLWQVSWNGSAWQPQVKRGYGPLGSAPAVAVSSGGYASVFWRGTGGELWQAAGPGSGALTGPTPLGFGPMATGPAAGVDAQGHVYVYWVGTDGNLREVVWDGSAWQGQFNRGYGKVG